MTKNIFQQQVTPEKPKVLSEERIYVYLPPASETKKGLASFGSKDFIAPVGEVKLRWPMDMMVQQLADPIIRPSMVKVLEDEFKNTLVTSKLIHPVTGIEYDSVTAEIKLNRENRNALDRPELVMLGHDFEASLAIGPDNEQYNSYTIKRLNPLSTPTIIQVHDKDFKRENNIVKVNWPFAHNPNLGSVETNGYGMVKVVSGNQSNLKFDSNNNLQVDLEAIKTNLAGYLAVKPTYGETNLINWPNRDQFVDANTGLAKRDGNGNTLLSFTKQSIGLDKVENRSFGSRTYNEFGANMKLHFESGFNSKLDKSLWDGPSGIFRDWAPPSANKNTVQRWLASLESEDDSLWSSINSLKLFVGFYPTPTELLASHPASEDKLGSSAFINSTSTYWAIRFQAGVWEWFDTTLSSLNFYEFVETNAGKLEPNAPIANVSVGTSGKWIQSDHVHPSDPNKFDAKPIEDAIIQITTVAPNSNDFQVKLADVKVVNQDGIEIVATIVETAVYLGSILNPTTGDKAITRNHKKIYIYDGSTWITGGEIGDILYNTNRTLNIPYVKTAQYLHNWKANTGAFTQSANSNEGYWAGTAQEFDDLNLADLPDGSLLIVTDDEYYEPGKLVTTEYLDKAGITLSDLSYTSDEQLAIVNKNDSLFGVPVTLTVEPAILGIREERRRLEALNFGSDLNNPNANHRLAIIVDSANGKTIGKRIFTPTRILQSDSEGNLETTTLHPANVLVTTLSNEAVALNSGQVVIANGDRTVQTWASGIASNRPIVSDGANGLRVLNLTGNRIIKTNGGGGLESIAWLDSNVIKSDNGANQVTLDTNRLLISAANNTIVPWQSGGVENAMLVRGANAGTIKLRTHTASNKILVTAPNGTLSELPLGDIGQILASNGPNAPGWINAPGIYHHLPQTRLTSNPSEIEANAFQGLVAVVLASSIPVEQMRNNCIYYF